MARAGMTDFLSLWSRRALAFSLFLSAVFLLLYAIGNYQGFLDSSQSMLLDLAGVSLWACCLAALCVLALLVITGVRSRRFPWLRLFGTVLALAASAGLVVLLQFLAVWTRG